MKKILLCVLVSGVLAVGTLTLAYNANARDLPRSVALATNKAGSTFNIFGSAVAEVAGKHQPMMIKVMPMEGPTAYLPMLATSEVQFGIQNAVDAGFAYNGTQLYGNAFLNLRIALTLVYNTYGLAVRKDSDIHTLADARGKRVAGKFFSHFIVLPLMESSIANGGLTWSDVVVVPTASSASSVKDVAESRTDVGYAATGMSQVKELDAKCGARILPYDPSPQAVARMQSVCPGVAIVQAEKESTGVKKGNYVQAVDVNLVTSKEVSDEVVYEIVKALWLHSEELKAIHPSFHTTSHDRMISNSTAVPYHPGSVRYFKEIGVWTPVMDRKQNELIGKK